MHDRVKYNWYLKGLAQKAAAAMRQRVFQAVKNNMLDKWTVCQQCTSEESVEAYHPDLSKFRQVVWLCKRCKGGVPRRSYETILNQLGRKYATFEQWLEGKR